MYHVGMTKVTYRNDVFDIISMGLIMIIKFQCKRCGTVFESDLSDNDIEDEVKCPQCGTLGPQRAYSAFSIKYSGFSSGYT